MGKVGTLLFGTLTAVLALVTGGIFYVNFKLSWKYKILIMVLPEKYLEKYPDCASPTLFGGLVIVNKTTLELEELEKFTILHEKGHCRCWRAISPIGVILKATLSGRVHGHGEETADYEYAADLYAAKNGAADEGILFMEGVKTYFHDNKEKCDKWVEKGINVKDSINRARLLRKWKRANRR